MKKYAIAGFAGPMISFAGIGAAIFINRGWWSLTDNAISDLGRVGLEYNFVLNISLILAAVVTFPSALWLAREERNIIMRGGIALFMLALVGLFLIGTFPEGTPPHHSVSLLFFYGGTLAMLAAGIGMSLKREVTGYAITATVLVEIALAQIALRTFSGVAIAEFIAAIGIVTSYYLLLYSNLRGE